MVNIVLQSVIIVVVILLIRCNVWSGGVADIKCNTAGGDQYMKLRDEWNEEVDDLDLSSIQNLFLASDYMDSNDSPKVLTAKVRHSLYVCLCRCRVH